MELWLWIWLARRWPEWFWWMDTGPELPPLKRGGRVRASEESDGARKAA